MFYIEIIYDISIPASRCFFPKPWHGEYFHLGFSSPLKVVNNTISEKGKCVENFGSHFVMEDSEYGEKCWRCMMSSYCSSALT